MNPYRPYRITTVSVIMFVAAIGCTMSKKPMSDKPEPAVAPVSIEDSIMPEKVPADTVAVVTAAPVYPSDEEKDLWVLVDSFRRTIPNRIDYSKRHNAAKEDSLSESTIAALKVVGDTLTKRTFALYTTMSLFGVNELMSEGLSYEFVVMLKRNPKLLIRIRTLCAEVPEEYRKKLLVKMGMAFVFDSPWFHLPNKIPGIDYQQIYDYTIEHWPEFLEMCKEDSIMFEPHEEYMQIGDLEYSI